MSDDPSPATGSPFQFKPNGRVSTNWSTLIGMGAGLVVIIGGMFNIKADIAAAARDAADAKAMIPMVRDMRDDLYRLRVQLHVQDTSFITPKGIAP